MSINKVILLGYTGKDPEVKDVAGTKVANLSLATTEKGYTLQKVNEELYRFGEETIC